MHSVYPSSAEVAESTSFNPAGFDQYVNFGRKLFKPLYDICPLKEEFIERNHLTVVRENTKAFTPKIGGIINDETAVNSMV